jgi:hypothetical protein
VVIARVDFSVIIHRFNFLNLRQLLKAKKRILPNGKKCGLKEKFRELCRVLKWLSKIPQSSQKTRTKKRQISE